MSTMSTPRNERPYMQERWYSLLAAAVRASSGAEVARRLGVSAPTVYQVFNGTGLYGTGAASTARLSVKVLHVLGSYACPHLTEQSGRERVITADQCRTYAHRPAPIGSPGDLAHWQACRKCPHRALSAPPTPRVPMPRKSRNAAAPASTSPSTPVATEPQP